MSHENEFTISLIPRKQVKARWKWDKKTENRRQGIKRAQRDDSWMTWNFPLLKTFLIPEKKNESRGRKCKRFAL